MPTIWEYADQVAAGDTGFWQAATRRTAVLLAPTHPVISLPRRVPVHQVLVQTTALVIYGRTRSMPIPGHVVSAPELAAWVTEHALPGPESAPGNIAAAVRHLLDSVAAMLRTAGHRIPEPGPRALGRHSRDPVVQQWHDLADVDDGFPGPLLCLGVAAMADTFGPTIV
ncbi:hypothetical protein [Actinoplanes utahensis]|uniref:Uncharacterized protein n=1 Tax=Actinoplanes utahensis TaxID=1869 RepID=A0A0A6UK27_ACTUT|nr:hypothetical protein [Actinoplanes utahensis]KHD76475.1 hypothetical protein MB27_17445 [Actinoplanes utahensis]GIF29723.1 hypothetical protein Aut01nite_27090 [Actinoplanes utahensis]